MRHCVVTLLWFVFVLHSLTVDAQSNPSAASAPLAATSTPPLIIPTPPSSSQSPTAVVAPSAATPSVSGTSTPNIPQKSDDPLASDEKGQEDATPEHHSLGDLEKLDTVLEKDKGPYTQINYATILQAAIRENAIDVLNDNKLLDEYAMATQCDLYKYYYKDDFQWNKVRETLRKSIKENIDKYPLRFAVDVKLQLARYDFDKQIYNFTDRSQIRHVNTLTLFTAATQRCGNTSMTTLPFKYRGTMNDPVTIQGIPLKPKDAETLLGLMTANHNNDHIVIARFNITVIYVQALRKGLRNLTDGEVTYMQASRRSDFFRFDIRLDNIEFFDPSQSVRIYTFVPEP